MALRRVRAKLEADAHFRELVKGSAAFFILRILGMAVAYAFTLVVTRTLGASAWGIFALMFSYALENNLGLERLRDNEFDRWRNSKCFKSTFTEGQV